MENTDPTDSPPANNARARAYKHNQGAFPSLSQMSEKKGLLILCGVLLVIIILLFNKYIFGGQMFLFTDIGADGINFDWPQRYFYSKYLRSEGIPTWSFAQGLGANVFPALMGDAGNWLLYLAPRHDIVYLLSYVEMLKLFMAGVFFFLFLKKINISTYASITGGALFAFCGFMTIGTCMGMFATEGCYLAFLLYSVELLRKNDNYFCFTVAIALTAADSPLLLYMFCLLLAAYLFFTLLLNGYNKAWPAFIGKAILLGALGLGIASFFTFGNIYLMLQSPRGSGNVSLVKHLASQPVLGLQWRDFYVTFLLRLLGNDMEGHAIGKLDHYMGYYHYLSAPCQYCGLISLLLIPQLFVLASRRLKWVTAEIIAIAVVPVVFPWFRYAFWFFSGDYFRTFSLLFSIVQILLAIKALDLIFRTKKVNVWLLFGTWVGLLCLVVYLSKHSPSIVTSSLRRPVLAFLLAEAALLWLVTKPRFARLAFIALPLVVFGELIFSNWDTYNYREYISKATIESRAGYNDSTLEVVKALHATDPGFFRLEKNYGSGFGGVYKKISWLVPRSYNDGQMQDYYSSPSYYSFNNKYYVNFLQKTDLIKDTTDESETRWINGLGQAPLMQIMASSKYLLYKQPYPDIDNGIYDSVTQMGGIGVFRNKYFLPLGFTYSACITESELNKTGGRKQIMLLKAACVADSLVTTGLKDFTLLTTADTVGTDTAGIVATLYPKLKADTLQISSFKQSHITGSIDVEAKKILFFSIPYDKGWKVSIDGAGAQTIILNYGFWGCVLNKGHHKVELSYRPPFYTAGLRVSEVSILLFLLLEVVVFIKKRRAV